MCVCVFYVLKEFHAKQSPFLRFKLPIFRFDRLQGIDPRSALRPLRRCCSLAFCHCITAEDLAEKTLGAVE